MTATLDRDTAQRFAAAYDSPAAFARSFLGLEPTGQQEAFLSALAHPGARVAVRSGHGTGKSTALAVAAIWFIFTRRESLVPATAPTAHQLQDVLWREMRRLVSGMSESCRKLFEISRDRIVVPANGSMAVARTARTENPDALQGFHAPEILFIIDEAAGVHDAIFEVARGALSTPSARVALTGNPTALNGYFYNAFHKAREAWTRLQFSCLESPLVDDEYPRGISLEFGEDSDVYRVRVLGDFPRSGFNVVVPLDWVEAAMARSLPANFHFTEAKILGFDLALEGKDRTTGVARQGTYARVVAEARGLKTSQLLTLIAATIEAEKPDAVFVDKTGLGAPIVHSLHDLGFSVVGVNFGEGATDGERFQNRRAEMWWTMREWFEKYDPVVQYHSDLRDDLIAPEYFRTPAWRIQLEGKESMEKRGAASPDYADALALTFAMPVPSAAAGGIGHSRFVSRYDPYRMLKRGS